MFNGKLDVDVLKLNSLPVVTHKKKKETLNRLFAYVCSDKDQMTGR